MAIASRMSEKVRLMPGVSHCAVCSAVLSDTDPTAHANELERVDLAPSIRSQYANVFMLGLTLLGAAYGSYVYPSTIIRGDTGLGVIAFPALGFVPLFFLARMLFNLLNYRYVLCADFVSENQGMLSWRMLSSRILYVHIRGVEVEQTILDRALGIGDLHLGSDINQGESEIILKGVVRPHFYKDVIHHRINFKLQQLGRTADTLSSGDGSTRSIRVS